LRQSPQPSSSALACPEGSSPSTCGVSTQRTSKAWCGAGRQRAPGVCAYILGVRVAKQVHPVQVSAGQSQRLNCTGKPGAARAPTLADAPSKFDERGPKGGHVREQTLGCLSLQAAPWRCRWNLSHLRLLACVLWGFTGRSRSQTPYHAWAHFFDLPSNAAWKIETVAGGWSQPKMTAAVRSSDCQILNRIGRQILAESDN
jgi:hypothetical protein